MPPEQGMTHTIIQVAIKAAKAAILTVRETQIPDNSIRPAPAIPTTGSPVLNLPMFSWKSPDKYIKLCNFESEAKRIFLTNSYNIQDNKNSNYYELIWS